MNQTAFKISDETGIDGMNEYHEWVRAFKDSMLDDVEPVSLVDYNVAAVLDYSREMGLSEEAIESQFRPWILEGYKRAHEKALQKFRAASSAGDFFAMEQAFCDLVASGEPLGTNRDELEKRHGYFGLSSELEITADPDVTEPWPHVELQGYSA